MADDVCTHCESQQMTVDFNKNNVPPLLGTQTKYTACVFCDELLSSLTSEGYAVVSVDVCTFACSLMPFAVNRACGIQCIRAEVEDVAARVGAGEVGAGHR